jgi:hypothetical protein
MSSDPERKERLVPARPASDAEAAAYMPRLPWRWLLVGALGIAVVAGGNWLKERQRAEIWRSQILRVHEELKESSERYLSFRAKVEKLVLGAAHREPSTFVDKRLHVPGLRSGRGLYLRVRASDLKDKKALAAGAAAMDGDVIASCMGLAPASARGLWAQGDFLEPEWIAPTRKQGSVMHLRVTDEVLARRMRTDLPAVLSLTRSDWLLLVVQQGQTRREPVDVFLWDLRSDTELLRARFKADGGLMPIRVRAAGAPHAPKLRAEDLEGSGPVDCSIAMQIKKLAGEEVAEVQNVPAAPARDAAPARLAPTAPGTLPVAPLSPATPTQQ